MEKVTIANMSRAIPTDYDAYEYMESLRWPDGEVVCPHCGVLSTAHYYLTPADGLEPCNDPWEPLPASSLEVQGLS